MDNVTLSMQNRLFWLGRYSERVFFMIQVMLDAYDRHVELGNFDPEEFCARIGIPCNEKDGEKFIRDYTFDKDNPYSIISVLDNMLGNGMVMREVLTTPTLSYLQMAVNAMEMASVSSGPAIELQWVIDDINAFRGLFDDMVFSETTRNITKCGQGVERISLILRIDRHPERLRGEVERLLARLQRTDLKATPQYIETLKAVVEGADIPKFDLLPCVEGLFTV